MRFQQLVHHAKTLDSYCSPDRACATTGGKTPDKVYTYIKLGNQVEPLPHLGRSNNLSLFLSPAYVPFKKRAPITLRTVRTCPDGVSEMLQDCFESTNWDVFKHQDLQQYTTAVLDYIKHCTDTVIVAKHIRVYPNTKPWMTKKKCRAC